MNKSNIIDTTLNDLANAEPEVAVLKLPEGSWYVGNENNKPKISPDFISTTLTENGTLFLDPIKCQLCMN